LELGTLELETLEGGTEYALAEDMSKVDIVAELDSSSRAQLKIKEKIQAMSAKLDDYFGSRDVCMPCRDADLKSFLQGEYLEFLQDLMQEIIDEQYTKHKKKIFRLAAQTNNKLDDISYFLQLFSKCFYNVNKGQNRQYSKLDEMQKLLSSIRQRINEEESNTSSKIMEQNEILQTGLKEVKTQLKELQTFMLENFEEQNKMIQTEKQEQTENMTGVQDCLQNLQMQITNDIKTQNIEFLKEQRLRRDEESETKQNLSHLEQGITRGFKDSQSEISKLISELNKSSRENYMINNVLAKEQEMRQNKESSMEKRLCDLQDAITNKESSTEKRLCDLQDAIKNDFQDAITNGFQHSYLGISKLIRERMANHREDDSQGPAITTTRSPSDTVRHFAVKMCLRCQ
jgi:DNA repair exonuclease SbcCD ATPase subunit